MNNKFALMTQWNIDSYKIAQFNTGNRLWAKNDFLLLCSITALDPDIEVISESNFFNKWPKNGQQKEIQVSGLYIPRQDISKYDPCLTDHDGQKQIWLRETDIFGKLYQPFNSCQNECIKKEISHNNWKLSSMERHLPCLLL